MIASALPNQLKQGASSDVDIRIHTAPTPWKVSYSWVTENIPPMLFPPEPSPAVLSPGATATNGVYNQESARPKPNYDIVLFLGMAAGRNYYTLETQGHRDGYKFLDVDHNLPADAEIWTREGAPEVLHTSFDTETLHRLWRDDVPANIDVRPSNNAGYYLCDYIYYTGLFEYWRQYGKDVKATRPCMFLHVPGETEVDDIARGVTVAEGLIRAMANCWTGEQR